MKKKTHLLTSLLLIATLILSGFTSTVAQAESPEEMEFSGTVTIVDNGSFTFKTEDEVLITVGAIEDGSFQLTVGGDKSLTILVPDDFEFEDIAIDSEFELNIKYNKGLEEWMLYKLEEEEQEEEREREEEGYFCSEDAEEQHPVALAIVDTYKEDFPDISYETVIGMFCEGEGEEGSARTGFGNIMLAFHTAEETGEDVNDILAMKEDGTGWGKIWQEMGLIGKDSEKPEKPGKPEDVGNGKPDDKGKPENPGNKPSHAGPKQ
jgi:hypothetical protein